MHSSKLIDLLNSFSPKEMKSFTLFLASPFYNKDKKLLRLYKYISLQVDNKLSKAAAFNYLFPDKIYEDKHIRYLMSDLLKLSERFLLIQKIESGGVDASLQLLDEFANRKLDKHFLHQKNKLDLHFSKNKLADADHFLGQLKMNDIVEKQNEQQHHRVLDHTIQLDSDALNRFFVLKKLKYACRMFNRQALLKENYLLGLPENWIDWLESNHYWGENIIKVYAAVFLIHKYPNNPIYFEKFNHLLQTKESEISQKDLNELFLHAINYCAQRIREGKNQYIEKALNLYLNGIKNQALLEDGYFSPQSFNNVVKLALRLEKYGWIENFMEKHKHFLPPIFQENTLRYNLAELNCYKKDFGKALSYLSKVEFIELSDQLGSRIMLSKIYYELKEETALLSLISSFMMFLKRNKQISETIRKTCLNFCNLLFLIVRGKVEGIETKIEDTTLLTDRGWLLEKVGEMKNQT